MSVYTQLDTHQFESILSQYNLGRLQSFEGVAAGIENTNYKIQLCTADNQQVYFLTIFEHLDKHALDFFIPFLAHLKQQGCALPAPKAKINGEFLFKTQNKWGVIFECLDGHHLDTIEACHGFTIGAELGKIHQASLNYKQAHSNPRGFYWLQKQASNPSLNIVPSDRELLMNEMANMQQHWQNWSANNELKKSFIHGDLFIDNCLFLPNGELSGVIDFYAGGFDFCVYDIAICIMAWAQTPNHHLNKNIADAIIKGYESVRPLSASEHEALPYFIRLGVLRFWVSRLVAQSQQQTASLTTHKNPDHMKQLLLNLSDSN
ncbi:homoserine kinase [Oceaniserpentilla sp. 4NH20-0058]|uniref:homoserine kinase n=1 Tax=Oceaniserpentilla sp. 4NH20-0058 TaxID=3127660 RepID=UPI0031072C81